MLGLKTYYLLTEIRRYYSIVQRLETHILDDEIAPIRHIPYRK
jgi:hypothetical protein